MSAPGGGGGRPPQVVEVAQVGRLVEAAKATSTGTLSAEQQATLRFEASGRIESIRFEDGQSVRAGALLVTLDSAAASADLYDANAQRDNLRAVFSRTAQLLEAKLVAQSDLDRSRAEFARSEAKVAAAQSALRKTRIIAPFSGNVGLRQLNVGNLATIGETAVEVVAPEVMRLDFGLPESRLRDVRVGDDVVFSVDAYKGEFFRGRVDAISPSIEASGRNLSVRARVPNPGGRLRSGQFARVQIEADGEPPLSIPEAAVWPVGSSQTVFRVENGIATQVPVELGSRKAGQVAVLSGLAEGDSIVVAGQQKLSSGAAVQVGNGGTASGTH